MISGIVRRLDGAPAAGIVVYAYQTDMHGIYPTSRTRHGALRGWVRTDDTGRYRFDTIRPGAYPQQNVEQHVHLHILEPGHVTYYIGDLLFDDDPLLSVAHRRRQERARGGSGIAVPVRDGDGTWHVQRDITLGQNVPDYPCERRWTFPVPFYQSIAWSPDGRRIAITAITESWEDGYAIWIASANGSHVTRLDTGGAPDLYPAWAPDGTRIAFASKRGGNSDIYVIGADGTGLTRLTDDEANDSYPSWSPDGTQIVFHSQREGQYDLYVMKADGSEQRRITNHPADDYNPQWSPSGDRIVFDSDRDDVEGDEIYVVSSDGSRVSAPLAVGVFPTWSPDGSRILYASEGLFVMRSNGSEPVRLLEQAVYGAWSPDGSTIAAASVDFDEVCKDHHSLVTMRADGADRTRLLP